MVKPIEGKIKYPYSDFPNVVEIYGHPYLSNLGRTVWNAGRSSNTMEFLFWKSLQRLFHHWLCGATAYETVVTHVSWKFLLDHHVIFRSRDIRSIRQIWYYQIIQVPFWCFGWLTGAASASLISFSYIHSFSCFINYIQLAYHIFATLSESQQEFHVFFCDPDTSERHTFCLNMMI